MSAFRLIEVLADATVYLLAITPIVVILTSSAWQAILRSGWPTSFERGCAPVKGERSSPRSGSL
jgi:hypothetical protein